MKKGSEDTPKFSEEIEELYQRLHSGSLDGGVMIVHEQVEAEYETAKKKKRASVSEWERARYLTQQAVSGLERVILNLTGARHHIEKAEEKEAN